MKILPNPVLCSTRPFGQCLTRSHEPMPNTYNAHVRDKGLSEAQWPRYLEKRLTGNHRRYSPSHRQQSRSNLPYENAISRWGKWSPTDGGKHHINNFSKTWCRQKFTGFTPLFDAVEALFIQPWLLAINLHILTTCSVRTGTWHRFQRMHWILSTSWKTFSRFGIWKVYCVYHLPHEAISLYAQIITNHREECRISGVTIGWQLFSIASNKFLPKVYTRLLIGKTVSCRVKTRNSTEPCWPDKPFGWICQYKFS